MLAFKGFHPSKPVLDACSKALGLSQALREPGQRLSAVVIGLTSRVSTLTGGKQLPVLGRVALFSDPVLVPGVQKDAAGPVGARTIPLAATFLAVQNTYARVAPRMDASEMRSLQAGAQVSVDARIKMVDGEWYKISDADHYVPANVLAGSERANLDNCAQCRALRTSINDVLDLLNKLPSSDQEGSLTDSSPCLNALVRHILDESRLSDDQIVPAFRQLVPFMDASYSTHALVSEVFPGKENSLNFFLDRVGRADPVSGLPKTLVGSQRQAENKIRGPAVWKIVLLERALQAVLRRADLPLNLKVPLVVEAEIALLGVSGRNPLSYEQQAPLTVAIGARGNFARAHRELFGRYLNEVSTQAPRLDSYNGCGRSNGKAAADLNALYSIWKEGAVAD